MDRNWQVTKFTGVLSIVIGIVGILLSLILNQDFNWQGDALGVLGLVPGIGIVFNLTVVLMGAFALLFHISALGFLRPQRRALVLVLFSTAMGSLMMIGLVPSDLNYLVHWISAALLFITYPAGLLVFSIFIMRNRQELADATLLLMGGYIVSFVAAYLFIKSFALAEIVTALFMIIWMVVVMRVLDKEQGAIQEKSEVLVLKSPHKSK